MEQRFKTQEETASSSNEMQDEFNKLKNTEVLEDRIVSVYYESCCGCGCDRVAFDYKVPGNSSIQDGDEIDSGDIDWDKVVD